MKIVVQNFKSGALSVADAPRPRVRGGGVLVRTTASLISAGTDRAVIGLAQKGYLGKALDRPDLARKVINKAKAEGLWSTYKVVQNLIAEPIPLGYSLVGEVVEVGREINEVSIGDRVACAGLGHANHAEFVSVPRNLFVAVPAGVEDEDAAYVTLGAIAMHGIRQADQQFGASVLIVGLGLVGQISVQICRAAGYRVVGLDLDPRKLELARQCGAAIALQPDDANLPSAIAALTRGNGVDAVLLTVGARDSGALFEQIAAFCRDRARVVVVGDVKMDIQRRTYFQKELEILQSRSYGPGRYDPDYEDKGQDYPIGYVRWTERRNMQAFLDLIADRRIDMKALTTHRFPIEQAEAAYRRVTGDVKEFTVGIVLNYASLAESAAPAPSVVKKPAPGRIGLGIIGAGQFAKGVLLPALIGTKGFDVAGVSSARGISAEAVRARYDGRYATSDAQQILDDPAVGAVVVATRHDSHGRYVAEALRRDKHVFVEKPLCLTEDELEEIERVAAASSGIVMVGFNRRFSPLVAAMSAHFAGRHEPMAMIYRVNSGRIPLRSETGWVHDPGAGGGRVMGEVCHFVDTLQALCGSRPTQVAAFAVNPGRTDLARDDIVTITVGFADGSLGTIHYFSNGAAGYAKERVEIFCQERIAVLDNFRRLELVANDRTKRKSVMNMQKGFAEEAQAFLDACRSGTPPVPLSTLADTTRVTVRAVQDLTESGFGADMLNQAPA
jgi:predicted dehydrogenase/threonine dehydrogenase-like Zn-dependent dehydrogenase